MKSPSLNFLSGLLTAIIFLAGLCYFGFGIPTQVNVISNVASPDGVFMATTNRASNRRWCEERINVHKKDEAFDWETEYIFNIDCGSEVKTEWENQRNLIITYSYNDVGVVRTYQEFSNKNKEVNISYLLKQ